MPLLQNILQDRRRECTHSLLRPWTLCQQRSRRTVSQCWPCTRQSGTFLVHTPRSSCIQRHQHCLFLHFRIQSIPRRLLSSTFQQGRSQRPDDLMSASFRRARSCMQTNPVHRHTVRCGCMRCIRPERQRRQSQAHNSERPGGLRSASSQLGLPCRVRVGLG